MEISSSLFTKKLTIFFWKGQQYSIGIIWLQIFFQPSLEGTGVTLTKPSFKLFLFVPQWYNDRHVECVCVGGGGSLLQIILTSSKKVKKNNGKMGKMSNHENSKEEGVFSVTSISIPYFNLHLLHSPENAKGGGGSPWYFNFYMDKKNVCC